MIMLTILSITKTRANDNTQNTQPSPDWFQIVSIAVPIVVTIIATGIGYLYKSERERRIEVEKQLSDKKYELYTQIIDSIIKMISEKPTNDLMNEFNKYSRELMIYGSDEVIKAIQRYQKGISRINNTLDDVKAEKISKKVFGDILLQIRKDMGNKKTSLTPYDLAHQIATYIVIEEEHIQDKN